jgi:hypothetical protein
MNKDMMRAIEADGDKPRQFTGEDHGPHVIREILPCDFPQCECDYECERQDKHDAWLKEQS